MRSPGGTRAPQNEGPCAEGSRFLGAGSKHVSLSPAPSPGEKTKAQRGHALTPVTWPVLSDSSLLGPQGCRGSQSCELMNRDSVAGTTEPSGQPGPRTASGVTESHQPAPKSGTVSPKRDLLASSPLFSARDLVWR